MQMKKDILGTEYVCTILRRGYIHSQQGRALESFILSITFCLLLTSMVKQSKPLGNADGDLELGISGMTC